MRADSVRFIGTVRSDGSWMVRYTPGNGRPSLSADGREETTPRALTAAWRATERLIVEDNEHGENLPQRANKKMGAAK